MWVTIVAFYVLSCSKFHDWTWNTNENLGYTQSFLFLNCFVTYFIFEIGRNTIIKYFKTGTKHLCGIKGGKVCTYIVDFLTRG